MTEEAQPLSLPLMAALPVITMSYGHDLPKGPDQN